ncbi:MAG: response regulator transcription factor [Oscillospiraceae bacterium]|nr:response regulator transcription factor [Oscillospiraceae bacterium]MBR2889910.1 response regulator transcription factor [Oscillospiraceae bacterium]
MSDKIRILAVDDEPDLRGLLRILLTNRGYDVIEAASGDEAVDLLRGDNRVDLVIMDIMMPGLSGVQACEEIRKFSTVPLLFLTAKGTVDDKIEAYGSGGDDYLVKPFSQDELIMKVESLTRRYRIYKGKKETVDGNDLQLDEEHSCVLRGGKRIELTDKEFAILRFFFQNQGQTVDVCRVYEGVWGEKYMPSSNNTVMVHILNLRKKLEADPANPKLLRTVWGKGYRFG